MGKKSKYVDINESQPELGKVVRVIIAGLSTPKLAEYRKDRNGHYWLFDNGREAVVLGEDRWKPA